MAAKRHSLRSSVSAKKADAADSDYGLIKRLAAFQEALRQGPVTKKQIKHRLQGHYSGVAGDRKFGRDLRALRSLGHQVIYRRRTKCYHLMLPAHLALEKEEVETLALIRESLETTIPDREGLQPIFRKIAEALPEKQREQFYRRPPLSLDLKPARDYRPHAGTIHQLEKYIAEKRVVRFRYQTLEQMTLVLQRRIEPYEVQYLDQHFYLLGYSPEIDNVLEFRIDRIQDLEPSPARQSTRRKRRTVPFKYRLRNRIARLGVSERFLNQRLSHWIDGDAIIEAEGYSEFRILQDLLRYGEQAELLEPSALRGQMREVLKKMWGMYEKDK